MNVYDFKVKTMDGNMKDLADYKGKVLLIVNTATECGFTPTYPEIQKLCNEFNEQGLEILDFPCNQFGERAPGSESEIHSFCTGRFGITFPQFAKIDVNGETADPLYKYLTGEIGFQGFDLNHEIGAILDNMLSEADSEYAKDPSIKWNFTKFLVDKEGNVIKRYEPTYDTAKIGEDIKKLV